jgi:hypothetical protein
VYEHIVYEDAAVYPAYAQAAAASESHVYPSQPTDDIVMPAPQSSRLYNVQYYDESGYVNAGSNTIPNFGYAASSSEFGHDWTTQNRSRDGPILQNGQSHVSVLVSPGYSSPQCLR